MINLQQSTLQTLKDSHNSVDRHFWHAQTKQNRNNPSSMHKQCKIEIMQNNMTMANKKLQEFYFIQHSNFSWLTNVPPNLFSNCNELENSLVTLCLPYMHGRSNNFLKWPTFFPSNNGYTFCSHSSSIIMLCNIVQQIMNT